MNARSPRLSIIIVSYNTKHLLKRCFDSIRDSAGDLDYEVIVVDNHSKDGSAEYIRKEFPAFTLIESGENLGFAGANNLGYERARGEFIVLLNTDAFMVGDSLAASVDLMDRHPEVGLSSGRQVGEDGGWQPSARSFPGLWNDFLIVSGLADKYGKNRFFGRPDMTYLDQDADIYCDWSPGAYLIIRKAVLEKVGFFDERFFLYYEEVDLCRRIKAAGWSIAYWPRVKVIHIGGASTSVFSEKLVSKSGKQMILWSMQSQYLYYRKHYGWPKAVASMAFSWAFNGLRLLRNRSRDPKKAEESRVMLELIKQAWSQTKGGRESPPRPWKGV
jgi:GT2 family glycosyltransferase